MSPWSNAAPTLRCGIRTVGTAFRRLVMRIGVEADDRVAVPGRIFLRVLHHPASIPVAREPRRHAQRMHDKHILAFAGILPCHVVVFRGLGISISCWHGSHHPLPVTIISPLRARRASVQRSSGIRPIPNGNRLHAPARKSAGPRRSRRSPRYPQMLPVVSCYFFLFEPR